ncbi:MAG TPA: O-antigen ligase family protein, partial [Fimbriimonadaceae bacterium]|nr:O-antigen ligase family protein [Fimbriimonadaceae bacterium]
MTSESRIDWSKTPIWLLAVAAFLAPLIGGTVATDATTLEPGYAPTMQAIFGGSEVPTLSHFVLAMLVCGAAIWILLTKRVIQAPMPLVAYAVLGLTIVVVASCLYSAFPALSFAAALEWIVYMIALLVAVGGVGRKHGPRTILGAVLGGCLILSLLAISEYFAQNDPTWRVFGTWQNPNALAGMLIIGFLVGAGLTMSHDRPMAIFGGFGTVACAFALALTQSKGAFLAAAIGLFALLAVTLLWMRGKGHYLLLLIRVAGCILALIALLAILRAQPAAQGGGTPAPLARVADASATQDQSSGFRLLLWKGAIELVKQHPFGWGIGAYRHESGRPGLSTQTQLAHSSYLQLAAETGVLGLALLLGLGVLWTIYSFKGASQSDPEALPLKVGVFAAVVGAAAHNGVDSDLYYFGTGFVFFLLLGLGMQLNADGVTPESVQPVPRWVAFALACCAPLGLLYFGAIEATKAHVRYHVARGEREPAVAGAE